MNYRIIARTIGVMFYILSCCMIPSAVVALYYNEISPFSSFTLISFIMFILGLILRGIKKNKNEILRLREGYVLVILTWVVACVFSALPYVFSGAIPSFIDALFEATSGITTTGSSILTNIEILPKSILFWRAFTHWIGGLGILTMAIAILPALGINGFQMAKAEASNSSLDKTAPKMSDMAKILYKTYFSLTAICMILLLFGGMNLFDASAHAFSAISTGGFSTKNASIGFYNSAYIEFVLAAFMVIGSISFPLIYRTVVRNQWKSLFKHEECKVFFIILFSGCLIVSLSLLFTGGYTNIFQAFREGFFHTISLMTTTGFSTMDYSVWPNITIMLLLCLMFIGGCSGSTAGGVKIIRIAITSKLLRTEFKKKLHPKAVYSIKVKNEIASYDTLITAITYIVIMVAFNIVSTMIISLDPSVDMLTAFSASVASIANVGPGFSLVGPVANFAFFADWTKLFITIIMVAGKLEFFALMMLFTPSFWNPDKFK